MNKIKALAIVGVGACMLAVPATSQARGSYGFSFSTGAPGYYAPPVYVAPPPPPPPVYYRPVYAYPAYPAYYRAAPSFSFSYFGR